MKPSIAALVSDTFYDGKLKTKKDQMLIREGDISAPFEADVIWCDTSSMGNSARERRETLQGGTEGTSFVNIGEARKILDLLQVLEASTRFIEVARTLSGKEEKPIGIICTYAGQKREIVRQLRQRNFSEEFYNMVKVDTVDSYQGKENLIIILSLVRNNSKKMTGFLAHDERVNVAVSRAMERLVVIGSSEMWGGMSDSPSKVYNYIKSRHEDDYAYSVVDAISIGVS
jgi:superfamily I DNA and/or RNA helicase